jgi:hypothetical protein
MWEKIKSWFGHSETILLARLQVILGVLGVVATALVNDPNTSAAVQSLLKPEYVPYYVIGIGILTEVLRRRGATDLQ